MAAAIKQNVDRRAFVRVTLANHSLDLLIRLDPWMSDKSMAASKKVFFATARKFFEKAFQFDGVNSAQLKAVHNGWDGPRQKELTVATLIMFRGTASKIRWATVHDGDMWQLSDGAGVPLDWEK